MNEVKSKLVVVCVLLEDGDKVLAARRSADMSLPWKWEFPGGKVEPGESLEAALRREIEEELSVQIDLIEAWPAEQHPLPDGRELLLHPFLGRIQLGVPQALEHAEIRWCDPNQILDLDWADADLALAEKWKNFKNLY